MNNRIRKRIALLARRLLAAQLEVDPKAKSTIGFQCGGWDCFVYWFPPDRTWNLDANRRSSNGRNILRVDDIPF